METLAYVSGRSEKKTVGLDRLGANLLCAYNDAVDLIGSLAQEIDIHCRAVRLQFPGCEHKRAPAP